MAESPFPYQGPLDPGQGRGREQLVADLAQRVQARRVTALLGPRRYGKTTLLRELAQAATGLSTVWVDFYEVTSIADAAIRLDTALASTERPFITQANQLAATLSLNLGVVKVELSRPPRQRPDPGTSFSLLLEVLVGAALRTPTLLVLDEFSSIVGVAGAAGALRTSLQHHYQRIGIIFAGSHPSMMRSLFSDRSQPFFGQADLVEVPPLAGGDVARFVRDGFHATGRDAGVAAAAIAELTRGHPQRAMQLADGCWRHTPRGEACDAARYGAALDEVRASVDEPMERILAGFERGERAVLRSLAHGGSIYGAEADLLELPNGTATHARQVLVDRGDLTIENGQLTIVDPLLADWLRRRLPI